MESLRARGGDGAAIDVRLAHTSARTVRHDRCGCHRCIEDIVGTCLKHESAQLGCVIAQGTVKSDITAAGIDGEVACNNSVIAFEGLVERQSRGIERRV